MRMRDANYSIRLPRTGSRVPDPGDPTSDCAKKASAQIRPRARSTVPSWRNPLGGRGLRSGPDRTCTSSRSRSARRARTRPSHPPADTEPSERAGSRGASRRAGASRFHTARCAKASRSKSPPQLAVDAHEQVPVERRGDAERIVVGQLQLALRLHEIGAEQQRVAGASAPRMRAQELLRGRRVEVADVGAEEQHEHRCPPSRAAAAWRRPDLVGRRGGRRPRCDRGGRACARIARAPATRCRSGARGRGRRRAAAPPRG